MAITKITTPELFDFSATNTALQLPTGTTAQRPTSPSAGQWRYNTTEKYVEYWDGGAWRQIDTEALPLPADFPSQNFNVSTYFGTDASHKIDAKFNEAANFNGSSSTIATPITTNYSNLSISCWVKFNALPTGGADATLVSKGFYVSGSNTQYLQLRYEDFTDQFTFAIRQNNTYNQQATSGVTASVGVWYNVVGTLDSSGNAQIYVNGSAGTSTASAPTMTNSDNFEIGSFANTVALLNGSIDQVRIFNTALTQQNVNDLYNDETTTTAATLNFPTGAGCIAAYQLDGDASDVGGTYGGVPTDIGYTGLQFQPDFVWIKRRVSGSESHALYDSLRGINKQLSSDTAGAEATNTAPYEGFTSFDTNGFTVDNNGATNRAPNSYVAWAFKGGGAPTTDNVAAAGATPTSGSFKIDGSNASSAAGTIAATRLSANTAAGFSIVKYSGGSGTLPHGLGVAPSMLIQKSISSGTWYVYLAPGVVDATSTYYYLELNDDVTVGTTGATPPTSTTFNPVSTTGTYISYLYANIAGYQKIGTYTGTGASGNFIETGFEPAFVLAKSSSSTGSWLIMDNKRGADSQLYPNLSSAEYNDSDNYFYSNGFEMKSNGNWNTSGVTFIYLAIAADVQPAPVLANSFSPTLYTGNGGTQNIQTDFKPDFVWIKARDTSGKWNVLYDSIRGATKMISSNRTDAEATYGSVTMDSNSFTLGSGFGDGNTNNENYVAWNWKAAGISTINNKGTITSITNANPEAGFSIVKYIGNEQASQTVGHGLGNSPDIAFIKQLDGGRDWIVPLFTETSGDYMELNDTANKATDTNKWSAVSTDTFTVGADPYTNGVGSPYIGYFFKSISGYQKIGSYTGNSGTNSITTGFQPRFVMMKNTANGYSWIIQDSARGTGVILYANLASSDNSTSTHITSFDSNGFTLGSNPDVNYSGDTYIYLAIA